MRGKEKNIVFILLSSAVVTLAWIGFGFYHTSVTSTLDEELTVQIRPIPKTFNASGLEEVLGRTQTAPMYELSGGGTQGSSTEASEAADLQLQTPSSSQSGTEEEEGVSLL